MKTHEPKASADKINANTTAIPLRHADDRPTASFTDNRTTAIAQRKWQEMAGESLQMQRLKTLQAIADVSPRNHKPVIQRNVTVNNVSHSPEQLIRDLWVRSHGNGANLVWNDAFRDAVHTFSAQNRVFATDNDLLIDLNAFIQAEAQIPAQDRTTRSNSFMANVVGNVSTPSAAHKLELLHSKYDAVAAHPYGWSFCALATMIADVDIINNFLQAIRAQPGQIPPQAVTWVWNNTLDQRVEFTVNARVYSTHAVPGHAQLYPLRGTGIIHGNGPIDMARTLRDRGELTEARKISLYQVYAQNNGIAVNENPYKQLGKTQKIQYVKAMDALI